MGAKIFWLLVLAGATTLTWTILWWAALIQGQGFHLLIWFDRWHEAWLEGVLFHLAVGFIGWVTWGELRKAEKHGH